MEETSIANATSLLSGSLATTKDVHVEASIAEQMKVSPEALAASKTATFDGGTVTFPSGEAAYTLSNGKLTWILSRNTAGALVCGETFTFTIRTYSWYIGSPQTPDFIVRIRTLNASGGSLNADWELDFKRQIACQTTADYSFYTEFNPDYFNDIANGEWLVPSQTWYHGCS